MLSPSDYFEVGPAESTEASPHLDSGIQDAGKVLLRGCDSCAGCSHLRLSKRSGDGGGAWA